MKRVYKLAEELSDLVWYDFDKWNKKIQNTVGKLLQNTGSNRKYILQNLMDFLHKNSINLQKLLNKIRN